MSEGAGPGEPDGPGLPDRVFHAVRLWLGRALW
jgi:hypothetical protein